jgi:hypothetical protein
MLGPSLQMQNSSEDCEVANGARTELDTGEKHQIQRFLRPTEADDEVEEMDGNELLNALSGAS